MLLLALTERSLTLLADTRAQVLADGGTRLELLDRWWDRVIEVNDQLVDDVTLDDVITFGAMLATPFHGADQRRIARRQKQLHLDGMAKRRQ